MMILPEVWNHRARPVDGRGDRGHVILSGRRLLGAVVAGFPSSMPCRYGPAVNQAGRTFVQTWSSGALDLVDTIKPLRSNSLDQAKVFARILRALFQKLCTVPNNPAVFRKDQWIDEQRVKSQPSGFSSSGLIFGITRGISVANDENRVGAPGFSI